MSPLPEDTLPLPLPSHDRTVVHVNDDALPEEPTVPLGPILLAVDGELVFFPSDGRRQVRVR